jgi:hypothetical protein
VGGGGPPKKIIKEFGGGGGDTPKKSLQHLVGGTYICQLGKMYYMSTTAVKIESRKIELDPDPHQNQFIYLIAGISEIIIR